jgi:hypothetical protein
MLGAGISYRATAGTGPATQGPRVARHNPFVLVNYFADNMRESLLLIVGRWKSWLIPVGREKRSDGGAAQT